VPPELPPACIQWLRPVAAGWGRAGTPATSDRHRSRAAALQDSDAEMEVLPPTAGGGGGGSGGTHVSVALTPEVH
jgi:hypothetical protein